ncbi:MULTISPECIES: hypothetical protein [Flavobacterium]|uniref:Uncharacterized protein n=1 Tax=Flavobacterium anhuiense TaxID=459526 RepID=A0AAC9D1U8_9FLAO|nr:MULTISPECIES: hypothetical protein [Flavobacterium]AOC96194.1 hypothetical protein BB050_03104 [Flavobacterium anhuiense]EJG00044.1 hypothetical protein FF52_18153 [Flavobacterium sp. F52]SCZ01019.1 hypothetical protein SAMN02927916_0095 [Flavobacterium anhuiense]
MENNKQNLEKNEEELTNQNANSAYSGSGGMQPGGSNGEAGRLSDYDEENTEENSTSNEKKNHNPEGKSVEEATDPSKLTKI